MLLGKREGHARLSRDWESNRCHRVSIFLKRLSPLAQCYFKGRNGSHYRINAALQAKDGHPKGLLFPRCIAPKRNRLLQVQHETWVPGFACDVLRLMLQQVPQILEVSCFVGSEELFCCL